jgi:hypothetical protein
MSYSRVQQAINLNSIRAKTLELALYSTNPTASDSGTEISGGAYARQSFTFTAPVSVVDGTYMSNSSTISFPQASGDWSAPVTHFGVRDAVGGDLLIYGTLQELGLDTSRTIRTGDIFRVAANTLIHKEED